MRDDEPCHRAMINCVFGLCPTAQPSDIREARSGDVDGVASVKRSARWSVVIQLRTAPVLHSGTRSLVDHCCRPLDRRPVFSRSPVCGQRKVEDVCRFKSFCRRKSLHDESAFLMPMTHAPETGARNRRQKTGVGFWRVCHTIWCRIFLAPDSGVG